ncbi:competence protein ComK [Sporosarcina sp. FSL K6-1522]|uniref:competence protein ComK n=1 Tax=Sporosarcina sp. FSL K6-1522 TaxID=2921554 RepID=UPI00315ADC9A
MTNYIVSFDTFMLQPVNKDGKLATRVVERNREFLIPKKPIHIVRKSCDFYGGSLQNSINSARLMLGNRHKTPIILASGFGSPYIFLPTLSPRSEQNVWFSYHAIDYIEPDHLGSIVYLENNQSIKLNASPTTMFRQYTFAGLLEKRFLKKQKQLSKSSFVPPNSIFMSPPPSS